LEKPAIGSYFLIMDFQWATAINSQISLPCIPPPWTASTTAYYTKKELKVTGIRNLSSQNQIEDTLIKIEKTCDLNQYECNCGDYESFKVYVGDSYYAPYPLIFPMLISKQYDAIRLYVDVYANANIAPPICLNPLANCSSCLYQNVAEAYLSIPKIKIYYKNTQQYLEELSLILTLLSFLLGVLQ